MAFLSGIVFCGGLCCLSFYIGFRIGKDFAVYGALYHIGAVCQRVPVHVNAEAMAAISNAVFFQVRAVGDSGLVKAFYLLAGFFIGNGNSNRNSGVCREESQPQPTMVLPSKSSKEPSRSAARAVKAPPMRNIAVISKVARVVLFFNIRSFLSFPNLLQKLPCGKMKYLIHIK